MGGWGGRLKTNCLCRPQEGEVLCLLVQTVPRFSCGWARRTGGVATWPGPSATPGTPHGLIPTSSSPTSTSPASTTR